MISAIRSIWITRPFTWKICVPVPVNVSSSTSKSIFDRLLLGVADTKRMFRFWGAL